MHPLRIWMKKEMGPWIKTQIFVIWTRQIVPRGDNILQIEIDIVLKIHAEIYT